jgi:hypothetical protein
VTYVARTDRALSSRAGRAHYVRQLEYLHGLLLDSIDRILAHAKNPPVIVLAADEGFSVEPKVFGEAAMSASCRARHCVMRSRRNRGSNARRMT